MGSALLSQWVKGPEAITIVDPAQDLAPAGVVLRRSAGELGDEQFDCVVVAIKPQMIDEIMPAAIDST